MGCEESLLINSDFVKRSTRHKAKVQTDFLSKNCYKENEGERPPQLKEGFFSITDEDIDMIEDLLLSHHLFYKVKSFTGREIITKLEKFSVEAGETIFRKGDSSDYFYIILEGKVTISGVAQGVEERVLERGQCFGDLGIQNKTSRSGTAKAVNATRLLGLRRFHFLRVSLGLSRKSQNEVFKEIKNIPMLNFLSMHQKHKISYLAQELKYSKGAYIFRKGQNSDCLYVIRSGKVRLDVPNKESIEVGSRQSFGESCLKQEKSLRSADAICIDNCVLLAFSKRDMIKYLGNSLQEIEITNKVTWALRREQALKVSPIIFDSMIDSKKVVSFKDGDVVAQKGDPIECFIISLEGSINDKFELELLNCCYLNGIKYQTEDLVKRGDGMVALIPIQQIQSKFNRKFDLLLHFDHTVCKEIESYIALQEYARTLVLEDLCLLQIKGQGQFGPTLRVKADSNIEFALKVFDKARVIESQEHESVYMLRRINLKITHNLIAKAYRIFSDEYRIYFLNKLVGGQTLRECLAHHGKLPLQVVKHFSACMISILEYLHSKRILWREMKVESFIIDTDGYLNLIDLMHLQELREDEFYIDVSSGATLYYLSPETLSGQGYGLQSDFWALGVIIYRMIVGQFPFGHHINEQDLSVLDVLSEQINVFGLKLPQWLPSDAKMLLKLLLNVNSLERSLISINRLKSMTFFNDYDWLGLMEKKVKNLPYLPTKITNKTKTHQTSLSAWINSQQSQVPPNDSLDDFEDI